MTLLEILGLGFLFCCSLMVLAWVLAVRINFYSLVDVAWAYGIGLLVILYAVLSNGGLFHKVLAVAMAVFWSLRLGTYLLLRLLSHYPIEDGRYTRLKRRFSQARFFAFFQFQAVSQVLFTLPFLFLVADPSSSLRATTIAGLTLFFAGFAGESLADKQLSRFRRAKENQGKVCDQGLWKYSRHPNYFFEWIIWCGISVSALSSPYGYIGLISPVLMYLTLNYVTGVPTAEEQSLKSRGHLYEAYQKTTSGFFPWFVRAPK